jgi:cytochrome P450
MLRLDLPGLPYHSFLDKAQGIEQAMRRIIAEKRALGDEGDVLSMLMNARDEDGDQLSEDDLLAHAKLLFVAGHETSANALAWTLLLLSQHPKIAADLLDELDSVLHGDAPTVEQLRPDSDHMPLLDRVIKESMRILPAVPWNGRVVAEPVELGGHRFVAGDEVLMSIYHTHHDPSVYPDPERFDPTRWENRDYSIFEYVPFGGGPRMCIGSLFAQMEVKIILTMILQRFRLELAPGARVDRMVTATMGPRQGVPMVVSPQDRRFGVGAGALRGNLCEMVEVG